MASPPLLKLENVAAGYSKHRVVNQINLSVPVGSITALIGHNGSGKSTLLKAIFGISETFEGAICFAGRRIENLNPTLWRKRGAAFVPQGNRVFGDLSVQENIEIGSISLTSRIARANAIDAVLELFPRLRAVLSRRAETLSGGEKQLVALAIAMVIRPRLLLLDEPSLGLSPLLLAQFFATLKKIVQSEQVAVLIAEQKVREVVGISDSVVILSRGEAVFCGKATELLDDTVLLKKMYS